MLTRIHFNAVGHDGKGLTTYVTESAEAVDRQLREVGWARLKAPTGEVFVNGANVAYLEPVDDGAEPLIG